MQLTLKIEPGLAQRHRTLRDCLQSAVIRSKGGVAGVAPELDMSPSQLGRKLAGNQDDPHRTLDVDDLEKAIAQLAKEGDLTPILYLVEKHMPSDDQRRAAALDQLHALLPRLMELASEVSTTPKKRSR